MWKAVFLVLAAACAVGLAALIGGYNDINLDDAGALNALNFAVVEHNRKSNDMYRNEVTEVVKIQRQVVSGVKYKITVKMARTMCRKEATTTTCPPHQDPALAQPRQCLFEVWSKPWENFLSVTKQNCN